MIRLIDLFTRWKDVAGKYVLGYTEQKHSKDLNNTNNWKFIYLNHKKKIKIILIVILPSQKYLNLSIHIEHSNMFLSMK